jgi:phosphate-selective porin OprO/OprP
MKKFLAMTCGLATCLAGVAEETPSLEAKVDRLREEIAQLRQLLAESMELDRQAAAAAAMPRNAVAVTYDAGYYTLTGPEGRLKFGGYAQFDGRWFEDGAAGESAFRSRRIRPDLRGELPNQFAWRMQVELAGDSANLVDGSMEYRGWTNVVPRVGQFKEPFGLEASYSPAHLDFMERSMMALAFSPLEDLGAGVTGSFLDKRLTYGVGLFNGRGRNEEDNNGDKDLAGRVQLTPFGDQDNPWISGLSFGASGTHGEQDEALDDASYRSAGRTPFLRYADGVEEDGNRDRWGMDVEWYVGPTSFKAEWIKVQQDLVFAGSTNANAEFDGWAISATWLLTGEEKPRNAAMRDVGLGQGSWGAWEVALRLEEFNANEGLLNTGLALGTDQAKALTAGLNWYPNGHIRVMANAVHVKYDDDITVDGQTVDDEDVALLRLQYSL